MEFTPEEKAFASHITKQVTDLITEREKGYVNEKMFNDRINEIKAASEGSAESLKALEDTLRRQGEIINEMNEAAKSRAPLPDIEKQLSEAKDDMLRAIKNNASHTITLKTQYTRASVTSNPMGTILPDYGQIGTIKLSNMESLFPNLPLDPNENGLYRYIDQTTATRNAAGVTEANSYPESAAAFTGYSIEAVKIGDTLPITEETVKFTARLARELELFVQTNVNVKVDSGLSVGTGVAPEPFGIYTRATTYTPTGLDIQSATIYDLIVAMSEDITGNTTYGGKYMPNVAMMNIRNINQMRLSKDANNNYILPPFATRDGNIVAGITVIENNHLTANTMVLGDSRFAKVITDGGIETAIGYNLTGDFAKDILTIKCRKYLNLLVRNADVTGWRKCTDILAALGTISSTGG